MPLTSPVTVHAGAAATHAPPAGLDVTRYSRMGLEPPFDGGFHDTVAWAFPAMATMLVGAPGGSGATGRMVFEGALAAPQPAPLIATTVK